MDCPIHQLLPTLKDFAQALDHQDAKLISTKTFRLRLNGKYYDLGMRELMCHAKYLAGRETKSKVVHKQLLSIIFGLKYSIFEAIQRDSCYKVSLVKLRKFEKIILTAQQRSFHAEDIYTDIKTVYLKQKSKFELLNEYYKQLIYYSNEQQAQKLLTKIHFLIKEIEGLKMIYNRIFWLSKESSEQAFLLLDLIVKEKNPLFEALLQIGFYHTDIGIKRNEHLKKGFIFNKEIAILFLNKVFDRPLLLDAKLRNIQPFN